jgi:hypothetical protein
MELKRADRELIRQLHAAGEDTPVSAVCSLQFDPSRPLSAEETEGQVNEVLRRVRGQADQSPHAVTVFANIGSFSLSAPARFIRQLLEQPEIATATANRQPEDVLIRPVRRKRITGPRRCKGKHRPDVDNGVETGS